MRCMRWMRWMTFFPSMDDLLSHCCEAKVEFPKNTAIVNSFSMEGTVQVTRGQLRRHMRAKRVGRMLRRAKRVGRMSILFQWRHEKDRQRQSVAGAGAIRRAGPGKFQTTARLLLLH